MLGPTLAEILRHQRDFYNARFAAARRRWPHLEPADFTLFVRDRLDPVVTAVAALPGDRAGATARIGYEMGLQLVAEKLVGPAARHPALDEVWHYLFPALARWIAADPVRVLGSLSNAAQQIAAAPGTRLDWWRQKLAGLEPLCADPAQLLTLAQVLAWRAGLAQYRTSALAAADALPAPLALVALGAPPGATWAEVRSAHAGDPWHGYDDQGGLLKEEAALRRIGAFRGFGGLFITPPEVTVAADQLLVRSGEEGWILIVDAFGATFHRAAAAELAAARPPGIGAGLQDCAARLPAGLPLTSAAAAGGTLALASVHSHTLWVGRHATP